jgi:hypothetical protein
MHLPLKVGNTFVSNRLSFSLSLPLSHSPLLADSYDTTYGIDCSTSRPAFQFDDPILYVAVGVSVLLQQQQQQHKSAQTLCVVLCI